MKKCFRCKNIKDENDFYKNRSTGDGLQGQCKECSKKTYTKQYNEDPEYRRRHRQSTLRQTESGYIRAWMKKHRRELFIKTLNNPEELMKLKVRRKAQYAVKRELIKKDVCCLCGDPNTEMHHDDYTKPYEIIWFCRKHHREHHAKINDINRGRKI